MRKYRVQRAPRQLFLDGLFVALLFHFFITGHIVPTPVVDLFRDEPQIVVSVEPESLPENPIDAGPLTEDGDFPPETRRGVSLPGLA